MTTMYVAATDDLVVVTDADGRPQARADLEGTAPACLAADPHRPEDLWCGTVRAGLWHSADGGGAWERVGGDLATASVSAVAVSPKEQVGGRGVIYAGTDPSALYRSEDGGRSWEELRAMCELPSAPTWSFPPRPDTSHVRWIALDPIQVGLLYVCIEAGALLRSWDGGRTWTDRTPDGPYDTHTLAVHSLAPGRLYSAAGDGFMQHGRGFSESRDGGDTWERPDEGLDRNYLWGLAVDPDDPDTLVVSGAPSPQAAHAAPAGDSHVYRRSGAGPWRPVEGLPEPSGTTAPVLASVPGQPGVFFAASNRGLHRSSDGGARWAPLSLDPSGLVSTAHGRGVNGLLVTA
jgi:photosystem II stability/assembly factor-like uncharacterized protein